MCGGGGGGGGETKYNWNDEMQPHWSNALNQSEILARQPYQQYGGQRIAGLNSDQHTAMQYGRNLANMSSNPIPVMDAARNQAGQTLNDEYLMGQKANPFAFMTNRFQGENSPYFRDMMNDGLEDIASKFHQTTASNLDRFKGANRNSSAYGQATTDAEGALAKEMGKFSTGMLNDQYNRSAALDESWLQRGSGAYEGERGRQMGAIGSGQNEQALAYERQRQLMGVGDISRSVDQDFLNLQYGDWQQGKNHPYTMMDWLTGTFSRAQGGMSPNSSFTQSGYSASPFSQVLGAGLLGYGALS